MKIGWLVLFFALVAGACPAQTATLPALPSWSDSSQQAWWAANPTPNLWPKAADALQAQLEADYKQNGARVFSDSDFQAWLDQLEWIRLGLLARMTWLCRKSCGVHCAGT